MEHRPPRPHREFTAEGRRKREVLSYSRRGNRFTPAQQAAWDAHHEAWVIPDEAVDDPAFDLDAWFGRGPAERDGLIVEIGCGVGEATAALAAARPTHDVLAFEVWLPGVAATLGRLAAAGADNVRVCGVDAAWSIEHLLPAGSIDELWTFFPDPWRKSRHRKRRLVDAEFAAMVVQRLAPGATWRLATDWADYADQMRTVLDATAGLVGGEVPRWPDRPVTKFERKGVAVGRTIVDFAYRRAAAG